LQTPDVEGAGSDWDKYQIRGVCAVRVFLLMPPCVSANHDAVVFRLIVQWIPNKIFMEIGNRIPKARWLLQRRATRHKLAGMVTIGLFDCTAEPDKPESPLGYGAVNIQEYQAVQQDDAT